MVNLFGWDVGQRIVVLGSGDVGMIMAGRFAELGKEVVGIIEKEDHCAGLTRNRKRFIEKNGIPLLTESTITRIFGQTRIEGVEIQSRMDGKDKQYRMACDTLIVSVGLIPEIDILRKPLKEAGLPILNDQLPSEEKLQEQLPWLFVCGNAREVQTFVDDIYDDGCEAGKAAARFLLSSV